MTDYMIMKARPSHARDILRLCLKAFKEGSETGEPSSTKMMAYIENHIADDHQLSLVAIVGGNVRGVVLGEVAEHAFVDGLVASDTVIYVSPSLRGTPACKELVQYFAAWCTRIPNLVGSSLGISQLGATTQFLDKVYRDCGYTKSGLTYTKGHSL